MIETYGRGDYGRGRKLAGQYLRTAQDRLDEGNELVIESALSSMLTVLESMLKAESKLAPGRRFGGDTDFALWIHEIIMSSRRRVHSTPASNPFRRVLETQLHFVTRRWILAQFGRVSRAELQELYLVFTQEMSAQGFTRLDDVLAYRPEEPDARQPLRVVSNDEVSEIVGIIGDYFDGLVAKDVVRLSLATGLDAETCSKLLDAYHDDCTEEGIASIRSITLPDLTADNLRLHSDPKKLGLYTLTVKGIRLDAVRVDGGAVSPVISKHLTLRKQPTGRWIIVAPKR